MHPLIAETTIQSAACDHAGPALPAGLLTTLFRMLAAALPLDGATPEIAAETFQVACALFAAMQPRDPWAAAGATRAVAAHFAAMDLYARAARPGLSDDTARRLRAGANTCSRTADAVRRASAPAPQRAAAPPETPRPTVVIEPDDPFQPRDRFGQPIPLHAFQRMTAKQRRATYAWPRNPDYEAEAIAEEEEMIAEQQALEASQQAGLTEGAMGHPRDEVISTDATESLAT